MVDLNTATLTRQSYGLATAGNRFGGPCGIWLECKSCPTGEVIMGSNDLEWQRVSDAEAASVFRRHGWTGNGDRMLAALCPKCAALAEHDGREG